MTLRGDNIAQEFVVVIDDYAAKTFA